MDLHILPDTSKYCCYCIRTPNMNKADYNLNKVGKRFKGVENFLKRVAFNLGNSPSQTEVKIISCIPIDVTDLQQKILYLERQLELKRVVNTALCGNLPTTAGFNIDRGVNVPESNNRDITNIPCLEDKLSNSNESFTVPSDDRAYKGDRTFDDVVSYDSDIQSFQFGENKQRKGRKTFFRKKKKFPRFKNPKTHYVYYAQTGNCTINKIHTCEERPKRNKAMTQSYLAEMIAKQYQPKPLGGNLSEISKFSSPVCRDTKDLSKDSESDVCSCCHGKFHNIDNHILKFGKLIVANPLITEGGYYDSSLYDVVPVKEKPVKIRKTLDVPKKRDAKASVDINCWAYDRANPLCNPLCVNYHTISHRTENMLRKSPKINKKDLMVKNIKKRGLEVNINKTTDIATAKSCSIDYNTIYPKYAGKTQKEHEKETIPVDTRTLPNTRAECLTNNVNNSKCQTIPDDDALELNPNNEKTTETLNQIKSILHSVLQEIKITSLIKNSVDEKSKKDAIVQKGISQGFLPGYIQGNLHGMSGNLQTNYQSNIPNSYQQANMTNSFQGNISNNLQCSMLNNLQDAMQSNMITDRQGNIPDYLRATVSGSRPEPGNITNNLHCNLPVDIQSSVYSKLPCTMQGIFPADNMTSSRVVNNISHSPYHMNSYLPSCSKQFNTSQSYYPSTKCYQKMPVFVQTPTSLMCTSCYRHCSHIKPKYGKQAITTATNTDTIKEHSKMTETLIKEIYKSMALNKGVIPKSNNTLGEHRTLRDIANLIDKSVNNEAEKIQPTKEHKKVSNVAQAVSELFRKKDIQVSSESPDTTIESRMESNEVSTPSQLVTTSTDAENSCRNDKPDTFLKPNTKCQTRGSREELADKGSNKVVTNVTDSTSCSDTETGIMFVHQPKQIIQKERKNKKNIFSKMFNSVKMLRPRNKKRQDLNKSKTPAVEETWSDSDDYQTVYSQNIKTVSKHRPKTHYLPKRRTHSKISCKQRKSPYMEQEYRRYWNEKLIFHNDKEIYTSDHSYSCEKARQFPYYRTYEARTSLIEPTQTAHRVNSMHGLPEHTSIKQAMVPRYEKNSKTGLGRASKGMSWFKIK